MPARSLTPAEAAAYRADGYVVVPEVFDAEELAAVDREIDALLPEHGKPTGARRGWMFDVAERSELTRRVAEDPRLTALAGSVVGPGVAIHSTKLVAKVPHSDEVCHWHQDEAFYLRPDDPATHSTTRMSVWLPLRSSDERDGCLWVVPGSHRWGLEPYVTVDHGTCRRTLTRAEYAEEHAAPVPVEAGSVVLFSAWTWHHSKNNATDHVRRAFIVSYQEATVGVDGHGRPPRVLRPAS